MGGALKTRVPGEAGEVRLRVAVIMRLLVVGMVAVAMAPLVMPREDGAGGDTILTLTKTMTITIATTDVNLLSMQTPKHG